ncbi:MAG: FHA domain-containing protein [Bdellovibrionales bacterium]|nr:FHA domain-containing protein [Bdellovibrionales bacterium]
MNEDKGSVEDLDYVEEVDERNGGTGSRARNRTVMLTPEMTGQVRALLHQDPSAHPAEDEGDPLDDFLPPLVDWDASGAPRSENGGFTATPAYEEPMYEAADVGEPEPTAGYDPMTTVAPPVRHEPPVMTTRGQPSPAMAPQRASAPRQSAPQQAARPAPQPAPQAQPHVTVNAKSAPTARAGQPASQQALPTSSTGRTRVIGFLVSFDTEPNGEVFEVRTGRWLITSRPTDHGDYILVNDQSISPLHAILRATRDGRLQVLDQLSEFGTGVTRADGGEEIEVAGGLEEVHHGDTVRFGERRFVVCTIPAGVPEPAGDSE